MSQAENTPAGSTKAIVALGGNLASDRGQPAAILRLAIDEMRASGMDVLAESRFFRTPCFPPGAGPDFVNAVVLLAWEGAAEALLSRLHAIEASLGRERILRWGTRTIDLDLICLGQQIHPDSFTLREWIDLDPEEQKRRAPEHLVLPHPRLQDRGFVLVPAADVWPDWRHPLTGRSIAEMRDALPPGELAEIVPLDGGERVG